MARLPSPMKPGPIKPFMRNHDARADVEASRDPVGLLHDDARDLELVAANAHAIARLDVQPQPKIVGDDGGSPRSRSRKVPGGSRISDP